MNTYSKSVLILSLIMGVIAFSKAQDLEPTDTEALLTVSVHNERGTVNQGDTISITALKDKKTFVRVTNAEGKFSLLVPNDQPYDIKYRDMNGNFQISQIQIPGNKMMMINFELNYELPRTYTLDNVFFVTGKASLQKESYTALNELVEAMAFKESLIVEISGHTDNVGEEYLNQRLSEARANTVRSFLIKKGIEPNRIKAVGFGETRPVASNDTPEGRQKNRRTQVSILSQ